MCACDLLLAFSPVLQGTVLAPLAYSADDRQRDLLLRYVIRRVTDEADSAEKEKDKDKDKEKEHSHSDDSDSDKEKKKEKEKEKEKEEEEDTESAVRAACVAEAFSKAVVFGALPRELASDVLGVFLRSSGALRNVARTLVRRLREASRKDEWKVVCLTLVKEFEAKEQEKEKKAKKQANEHFGQLVRWFTLSYGVNPHGDLRASMLELIHKGILWAVKDATRLPFLGDCVAHFARRLHQSEAKSMLAALREEQRRTGEAISEAEATKEFEKLLGSLAKGEQAPTPRRKAGGGGGGGGGRGGVEPIRKLDLDAAESPKEKEKEKDKEEDKESEKETEKGKGKADEEEEEEEVKEKEQEKANGKGKEKEKESDAGDEEEKADDESKDKEESESGDDMVADE
eukprot:TRINITY_DN1156_c0_g4_i1.p1 TRINITY_DN1156_c0_g4~~TRINITY_DN1156_c0_g4_i1.p1  ORF type:complete len:400 (+),score=165.40 TRINITY_DN1156_c0_g4_i1:374-1573(+)